jgi:endonuclease/exonuclease/phosphatase (EEP) superfamily protein YafD
VTDMNGRRRPGPAVEPPSWDSFATSRPFQGLLVSLGVLFVLPGLLASYLRVLPPTDDMPALVASFISYGMVAYLLALTFFAVALVRAQRRRILATVTVGSALLLVLHLCWLAPLFIPDDRFATTATFTIMSLNLRHGSANSRQVVDRAAQADVVVFLEATPNAIRDLDSDGWNKRFPYSTGEQQPTDSDSVVYSRFPMTGTTSVTQSLFQQWITTVHPPGLRPVRVIAAHPCNPYCGYNRWSWEHARLRATADANLGAPLIVAGDFNAVDDHGPIRALRHDGLKSATDIVGAGWLPTYPANRRFPPLIPIDHILVNRFLTASSIRTFKVSGTDHLGLLATIAGTG